MPMPTCSRPLVFVTFVDVQLVAVLFVLVEAVFSSASQSHWYNIWCTLDTESGIVEI